MSRDLVKISKFLRLVLRHKPEEIGLVLDGSGWTSIEDPVRLANQHGTRLTRELVQKIVAENDKQRFAISEDGLRIRANQGHSIAIDLGLNPSTPPLLLYHGTASRFIDSIQETGLHSANRQHVHLSPDHSTATKVGQRHGQPLVLTVRSGAMAAAGHLFYLSNNEVWLTDRVPVNYIEFPP